MLLHNQISEQYQSGEQKYPYAIEIIDNKTIEFELVDNVLNQYVHVDVMCNHEQFGSLLKRFTNVFGKFSKYDTSYPEYEWMNGVLLLGMNEDGYAAHVQTELTNMSNTVLTNFVNTQITIDNVFNVFVAFNKLGSH